MSDGDGHALIGAAFALMVWVVLGSMWLIATGVDGLVNTEGDTGWESFKITLGAYILFLTLVNLNRKKV